MNTLEDNPMKMIRALALAGLLAVGAVAVAVPANAQQGGANNRGGQNQAGNAALAGLIDVLLQNTAVSIQAALNDVLNENEIRVVNLNDVLNGNQTNILTDILNESTVLSDRVVNVQNVLNNSLNNNEVLKDFLNNNNVAVNDVVAVDVLSGGDIVIYTFDRR
jgi:hypothetical protein